MSHTFKSGISTEVMYDDLRFPAETTISTTVDIQDYTADTHMLWDVGDVPASDASGTDGVSGMIICSLQRDHTVADNTTKHIYLTEADFHFQTDALGSRTEYSK